MGGSAELLLAQEDTITSQLQTETAPLSLGLGEADGLEHDTPGWVLGGRYRVCGRIGTGGMAEVFRATDLLLRRDVAVKVFRSLGPTDDTGGATRQQIELQALAQLSHPNLITLFDASITDVPPYLVMELVEGPNLAARIATGPLPDHEVRTVGAQIADALGYVHAHDMVHRDVKPANILLGEDCFSSDESCRARLSDFGIVRLLGSERMTSADFTLGTASYLAPEQARGGDVTPAADIYSLGLVLIEALTGVRSFDGPPVEAVLARLARDPEIPAGLAAPWPALLRSMTARDPQHRPSAGEVARVLRSGRTAAPAVPVLPAAAAAVAAPLAAFVAPPAAADAATAAIAAPWTPPSSSWPGTSGARPATPFGAVDDVGEFDEFDDRRHVGRWFALAGLFAMVIVGAACFLAFGSTPTGTGKAPANSGPSVAPHSAPASQLVAPVVQPAPQQPAVRSAAPATSAVASHSAAPKASHANPAPSAVAPVVSAPAPSTSAAPMTSSVPSTSAPQTSAAFVAPQPSPTGSG